MNRLFNSTDRNIQPVRTNCAPSSCGTHCYHLAKEPVVFRIQFRHAHKSNTDVTTYRFITVSLWNSAKLLFRRSDMRYTAVYSPKTCSLPALSIARTKDSLPLEIRFVFRPRLVCFVRPSRVQELFPCRVLYVGRVLMNTGIDYKTNSGA